MQRHVAIAAVCAGMLGAGALCGCTFGPEKTEILVSTTPPGASCTLTRAGQPVGTAGPTPAIALVEPTKGDITIVCHRHDFADATATLAVTRLSAPVGHPYAYEQRIDIALAPIR